MERYKSRQDFVFEDFTIPKGSIFVRDELGFRYENTEGYHFSFFPSKDAEEVGNYFQPIGDTRSVPLLISDFGVKDHVFKAPVDGDYEYDAGEMTLVSEAYRQMQVGLVFFLGWPFMLVGYLIEKILKVKIKFKKDE